MSLERELRAVLSQEAEMTNATRPDLDGLISGGQSRRRRRNLTLLAGAAAAVVLVGGGIFGFTQLGDGDDGDSKTATEPSESVTSAPTPGGESPPAYETSNDQPGTYRRILGAQPDGELVAADWTFAGEGWDLGDHPVVEDGGDTAGVSVYRPLELAGDDACTEEYQWVVPGRPVASTIDGIAQQLTELPQATVLEPPTATEAFGHSAVHVRVRIEDRCDGGLAPAYYLADTEQGAHGISYWRGSRPTDVVMDFLVVDVDGTPVVAEYWHHPGADDDLVSRVSEARASISIVSGG